MTDPAIIEAVARALREKAENVLAGSDDAAAFVDLRAEELAIAILAAVTPLIEAATLERAAKVAEEISPEVFQTPSDIAAAIRALVQAESSAA